MKKHILLLFGIGFIITNNFFNRDIISQNIKESKSCFLDTTLNNLVLLNDLTPIVGNIQLNNCDPDCRKTYFNLSKSELLEIFFYPGRINNQCSYFKVSIPEINSTENYDILDLKNFITGEGVTLLSDYDNILSLFTNDNIDIQHKNQLTIVTYLGYKQKSINCDIISEKYDLSLYQSKYIFKDNKLISFEFGFIYP